MGHLISFKHSPVLARADETVCLTLSGSSSSELLDWSGLDDECRMSR